MRSINLKSIIVILGALGFAGIVTGLQIVQNNYDPVNQYMSELAFGEHGSFMLIAFFSFSVSVFAAQSIITTYENNLSIRILLIIASLSLAGAGIFKLGAYTDLHIGLIAITFILVVLAMCLIPRLIPPFQQRVPAIVCRACGIATAVSVVSADTFLPAGTAQRVATGTILCWLIWLAFFHHRQTRG